MISTVIFFYILTANSCADNQRWSMKMSKKKQWTNKCQKKYIKGKCYKRKVKKFCRLTCGICANDELIACRCDAFQNGASIESTRLCMK
jgi:hypothetical protein